MSIRTHANRWVITRAPRLRSELRKVKPSYRRRIKDFEGRDVAGVFEQYYEHGLWDSTESVSGFGSTLDATSDLREALPQVLRDHEIRTLLDVPCGDFNWMSHVDLAGVGYIGGDIVPQLIERLRTDFGSPAREFRVVNLIEDQLPDADALLCRDCLLHLNFEAIRGVLRNVARSEVKWCLISHYPDLTRNVDSPIGPATPVNLTLTPFNMPQPLLQLRDKGTEKHGLRKTLGLWSIDAVRAAVPG